MRALRWGALAITLSAAWAALVPLHAQGPKRQRDLISREEIEASPKRTDDIYQVIRSLRPHFLESARGVRRLEIDPGAMDPRTNTRTNARVGSGGSNEAETAVYLDRNHIGGIDALKGILAEQVGEVRYLDASKALSEFGVNRGGPAIVIRMYKGLKPEP